MKNLQIYYKLRVSKYFGGMKMDNKSKGKELQETLTHKWKNVWEVIDNEEKDKIFQVRIQRFPRQGKKKGKLLKNNKISL